MIYHISRLLRPQQWIKNGFVFLPLFFDGRLVDFSCLKPVLFAFFAYSFAASGIYCLNDICDVEVDRKHPQKSKRPIASGAISKTMGYTIMVCCFLLSFYVLLLGSGNCYEYGVIALYIMMNIAYCINLKHRAIVDVFTIAIGFVFRVLIGGISAGISLSHWIVFT